MPTPLVGMLLFIASEVMFFGGLFAAYFNCARRARGRVAIRRRGGELDMPLAAVLTAILVGSSFTMQFGVGRFGAATSAAMRNWGWSHPRARASPS